MTQRIKILEAVMLAGKMYVAGKVIEISEKMAANLIDRGIAEPYIAPKKENGDGDDKKSDGDGDKKQ